MPFKNNFNGMPNWMAEMFKKQEGINKLFAPELLTTPKEIDSNVVEFCKGISEAEPIFLDVTPEDWCRELCCDLNVIEYIKLNGGRILCGYKIWYHEPSYIEAERHAVWESDTGDIRDITFNSGGEERIVFIADIKENQDSLDKNKQKIRCGLTDNARELISFHEQIEAFSPVPNKMSNEDAWSRMMTYAEWKAGKGVNVK
ncbi:hypothetical protein EIB86_23745 [Vibrio parahaemolyticus]|nr:hypothetical protein [Vibrio parahaemolyticus]